MNNMNPIHRTVATLKLPHPILALIAFAKAIVQALSSRTRRSPIRTRPLATVTSAIADIEAAQALVQTRAKGAVQARNTKRASLVALLRGLLAYVQKVADADLETRPRAHRERRGMSAAEGGGPCQARVFAAKHGDLSGSVSPSSAPAAASTPATNGSTAPTAARPWQGGARHAPRLHDDLGLVPGSTYLFRGRVVDKTGDTDWYPPVSLMVR